MCRSTVIAVYEISVGYWASGVVYPEDHAVAEHARRAVQLEVEKVLGELASPGPVVMVQAVSGTPRTNCSARPGTLT